jgi:hypothetical protein
MELVSSLPLRRPSPSSDRRRTKRLTPPPSWNVRLGGVHAIAAELIDVSATGLGIRLPEDVAPEVGSDLAFRMYDGDERPLLRATLEVGHVHRSGRSAVVGGRFRQPLPLVDAETRQDVAGRVALADPELLQHLLGSLRKQRAEGELRFASGRAPASVASARVSEGPPALSLVVDASHILPDGSVSEFHVNVFGAFFILRGTLRRGPLGDVRLQGPFALESVARRYVNRASVAERAVTVTYAHPLDPDEQVVARVADLAPLGVGIVMSRAALPFPPMGRTTMALDAKGLHVVLEADVTHATTSGEDIRLGLSLHPRSEDDALAIARYCQHVRFPKLVPRRETEGDALEHLLRESGYLSLREDSRPPPGWHDATADEHLSVDTVHREAHAAGDELVGHLSLLRVYKNTWMYHQLATLGQTQASRECRKTLYLDVVNWVGVLGGTDGFSIAYFDRCKAWHQWLFASFVDWVGAPELVCMAPLDRMERETELTGTHAMPPDFTTSPVTRDDASKATELISASMPPLMLRAMDLTADLVAENLICATRFADAGLERGRVPLALRRAGEIVGVALCEYGSRSLSLFNLVNVAQIYLQPDVPLEAELALLEQVQAFYTARGIAHPIIVTPPGMLRAGAIAGLRVAETMGCIAMNADGLKQYANFLAFHLGRHAGAPARAAA